MNERKKEKNLMKNVGRRNDEGWKKE